MNVLDLAQRRHSPRAFSGQALAWEDLAPAFEAARLSSSSYNNQPWRFVVGLKGEAGFDALLHTAVEANRTWMKDAGAIVGVVASGVLEKTGEPDHAAMYSVGMAVNAMEFTFVEQGLTSMQAGGFDRKAFGELAGLPAHHTPIALLAVGYAPDGHTPNPKVRKDLHDIVFKVGERIPG
ncbi:MAG: nitroreductase family protein [Flavobacteriales bacterium]